MRWSVFQAWGGLLGTLVLVSGAETGSYRDFNLPPHEYFRREPADRFARVRGDLEAGRVELDRGGEKVFVESLLRHLGIPASSQMLLFSTTSLQLSRIHPGNPRALYFSEDLYLGYIPGGRLELAALEPELGVVFYIFDIPRDAAPVKVERATRCMNCHAGDDTGYVPGLVVKSVVPGTSGGSLDAFRREQTGHGIPLSERFGGWYVTGLEGVTNHWANAQGRFVEGELTRVPVSLSERVDPSRYPRATTDVLAQLVHEHQVGFVNRVVGATYRARSFLAQDGGASALTPEHARELDGQAELLTRYLLFAEEAALPAGGIAGDPEFRQEFLTNRREVEGASLKDFELKTRLFRYRCSYMIYTALFEGMPAAVGDRVWARLERALRPEGTEDSRHLGAGERVVIRRILKATLGTRAGGW